MSTNRNELVAEGEALLETQGGEPNSGATADGWLIPSRPHRGARPESGREGDIPVISTAAEDPEGPVGRLSAAEGSHELIYRPSLLRSRRHPCRDGVALSEMMSAWSATVGRVSGRLRSRSTARPLAISSSLHSRAQRILLRRMK